MWHIEEELNNEAVDMTTKGRLCEDIVKLNTLRNNCIKSIDAFYDKLITKQ